MEQQTPDPNTIQNILLFIRDSEIENKRFYFGIFRDQLSQYEWVLLFYYGFYNKDQEPLYNLIVESSLLVNFNTDLLFHKQWDEMFYEPDAYSFDSDYTESNSSQ